MKRVFPLLLVFCACAEPASVRVEVETREPTVERTALSIRSSSVQVECEIANADSPCPFEAPSAEWTAGDPFSFILYGDPDEMLEVEVFGLNAAGQAASSAREEMQLPAGAGQQETVEMVLKARTEVHGSCQVQLGSMIGMAEGRDALGTIDVDGDGLLEIVIVARDATSIVRFSPDAEECLAVERGPDLACALRPTDLAVGNVLSDTAGQQEVVAVCEADSRDQGAQLRVARIDGPSLRQVKFLRRTLPVPLVQVSNPVLVDLEGDGVAEVAVIHSTSADDGTSRAPLQLLIWKPDVDQAITIPLENLGADANVRLLAFGPLVLPLPGSDREGLVITGYLNQTFLKQNFDATSGALGAGVGVGSSPIGPSLTSRLDEMGIARAVLVSVFPSVLPQGVRNTLRFIQVGGSTNPQELNWSYGLPSSLSLSEQPINVRIAIGDLRGQGERSAVIAHNGNAFVFPVAPGREPAVFPITDQPVNATMRVLLANLDGRAGAEVIAFNPDVARIDAIDGTGETPVGWPLTAGGEGADNRVILEDLDRDGRAEVIVFSLGRVEVFSLGPGSYDPDAMPWPYPLRDQRLTASNLNEKAP